MSGNARGGSPGRLFVEGTTEENHGVGSLEAVYTRRHLSTELLGTTEEMKKTSRRPGGLKTVTTRIVRKTTTLTRGEEKSVTESLVKEGRQALLNVPAEVSLDRRSSSRAKKAKVIS